jgi:hypothetical protein
LSNPKFIILIVSLAGGLGGVYFTPIAKPAQDFPVWVCLFALLGIMAANVVFLIITEITQDPSATK